MNNQYPTSSQQRLHQMRVQNLQNRWRHVSSLSLYDFTLLWNETIGELRDLRTS